MPYVYSYHVHYGLSKLNRYYINAGYFDKSLQFSKIILQHLSNDNLTLYAHIHALIKTKQFDEALTEISKLSKVINDGLFIDYTLKLEVYVALNDVDKYLATYQEFANKPERLLALNQYSYKHLTQFSMRHTSLYKYTPIMYKKYQKYHGYDNQFEKKYLTFMGIESIN
ncbi:MAG: hypothetical protein Rsou_0256 [Candidatus Ruthia sp. Asou_11_S2]|nr:hypothetical protein [Candidatus Ruthia sp. Asou_11_S2]